MPTEKDLSDKPKKLNQIMISVPMMRVVHAELHNRLTRAHQSGTDITTDEECQQVRKLMDRLEARFR